MLSIEKDHSKFYFPWRKPSPAAPEPNQERDGIHIDAAVFVCDVWLTFGDDTAVHHWASGLLQNTWPEATLAPQARVEAIVGHKRLNQAARVNMRELLYHIMSQARLDRQRYQLEFLEIQVKAPPMQIWGVTAVLRP